MEIKVYKKNYQIHLMDWDIIDLDEWIWDKQIEQILSNKFIRIWDNFIASHQIKTVKLNKITDEIDYFITSLDEKTKQNVKIFVNNRKKENLKINIDVIKNYINAL